MPLWFPSQLQLDFMRRQRVSAIKGSVSAKVRLKMATVMMVCDFPQTNEIRVISSLVCSCPENNATIFCPQTESASVDADIQKEFSRQKEHLERSVASLRKKLEKDSEIHKADNVRIMQVGHKSSHLSQSLHTHTHTHTSRRLQNFKPCGVLN